MSLDAIQQSLTEYLRTEDLHAAANTVVEARSTYFLTADGSPDYAGRTFAYREWYGETINSLNLPQAERSRLLGKMRYHVGNALRRELSAEELESSGLLVASPHDRNKQNYENRSTPHRLIVEAERLDTDDDIREVVRVLNVLAHKINLSEVSSGIREELRQAANRLITRI